MASLALANRGNLQGICHDKMIANYKTQKSSQQISSGVLPIESNLIRMYNFQEVERAIKANDRCNNIEQLHLFPKNHQYNAFTCAFVIPMLTFVPYISCIAFQSIMLGSIAGVISA